MCNFLHNLWSHDAGQDIAEYAIMLAVILVLGLASELELGRNRSVQGQIELNLRKSRGAESRLRPNVQLPANRSRWVLRRGMASSTTEKPRPAVSLLTCMADETTPRLVIMYWNKREIT